MKLWWLSRLIMLGNVANCAYQGVRLSFDGAGGTSGLAASAFLLVLACLFTWFEAERDPPLPPPGCWWHHWHLGTLPQEINHDAVSWSFWTARQMLGTCCRCRKRQWVAFGAVSPEPLPLRHFPRNLPEEEEVLL